MKIYGYLVALIAIILSLVFLIGCNDDLNEEEEKARLAEMEQEVLGMISDLSCTDSTECKYIGFGAKPCGGFWRYLIYSSSKVDTVLFKEKVSKYNEYNRDLNSKYGWISDCGLPPIPIVKCIEGECTNINPL